MPARHGITRRLPADRDRHFVHPGYGINHLDLLHRRRRSRQARARRHHCGDPVRDQGGGRRIAGKGASGATGLVLKRAQREGRRGFAAAVHVDPDLIDDLGGKLVGVGAVLRVRLRRHGQRVHAHHAQDPQGGSLGESVGSFWRFLIRRSYFSADQISRPPWTRHLSTGQACGQPLRGA